jgi:hypothetical protein
MCVAQAAEHLGDLWEALASGASCHLVSFVFGVYIVLLSMQLLSRLKM